MNPQEELAAAMVYIEGYILKAITLTREHFDNEYAVALLQRASKLASEAYAAIQDDRDEPFEPVMFDQE